MLFISIIIIVANIRIIYAIIMTRKIKHLLFGLYSYIYLGILIPIKIWALITVNITKWGTGSRLVKAKKNIDLIPIIIWDLTLVIFIGISFYKEIHNQNRIIPYILFGLNVLYIIALYIYYLIIQKKYHLKMLNKLNDIVSTPVLQAIQIN